ncbi:MAG: VWA domain-containing protein, partial [Nitrospinae bacterium]|nr:VWA domain-containing protein [Nitrospinota bacterium]
MDEIAPEGWTNLSAGLLEAFAQLERSAPDDEMMRVIVLTDGKANRGITDTDELRRLVGSARSRGITVSTMGCGAEFDEDVLVAMAEAGGGRYTYIQSTEQ